MSCTRGCCDTQAEHYRGVALRPQVSEGRKAEKKEAADMAAYARLRKQGLQPKGITGAATLEREAKSVHEITQGHLIRNDRLRREVDAAHASAAPPSLTPTDAA